MHRQNNPAQEFNAINCSLETCLKLRGRQFSLSDLEIISRCVSEHFDKGRTYISLAICKELGWKQPNGWPKDRACRDVLIHLEQMGLIKLPPPRFTRRSINLNLGGETRRMTHLSEYDLISPIEEFPQHVTLEFAKGNNAEKLWNAIVNRYHYLGHKVSVGRCIKYLVKAEGKILGALSFSSPVWRLASRDSILCSLGIDPVNVQDYVINNSRFLILPNVQVPNLASMILSLATSQIVIDWNAYYSVTPQVAETFVQPSRFLGTCYKAANWIEVGFTKGYAKKGTSYHNGQEPKQIFLYGLNRRIRQQMLEVISDIKQQRLAGD